MGSCRLGEEPGSLWNTRADRVSGAWAQKRRAPEPVLGKDTDLAGAGPAQVLSRELAKWLPLRDLGLTFPHRHLPIPGASNYQMGV